MDRPEADRPPEGWRPQPEGSEPSWGNVSDGHWSRSRRSSNREAIDHMRDRSKAPGVAEGGGARNHYCMKCDGVIPSVERDGRPAAPERCPHCGVELDERVRAMFNWVEIDEPPAGDPAALLWLAVAGALAMALVGAVAYWILR